MIRFSRNDYLISWICRNLICDNISPSSRSEWLIICCSAVAGLSDFCSEMEYWNRFIPIELMLSTD